MKKDDYLVLICRILAYLYECVKNGETPDMEYLHWETEQFPVCQKYWTYIIRGLQSGGYIDGVEIVKIAGSAKGIKVTPELEITPEGILYLQQNSALEKAKEFLKTLKEICPGI